MSANATAARPAGPLLTFKQGSSQHRTFQVIGWACLAIPLLVMPYILPSFRVGQLAQCAGWAVAILGMNMVIGYSGLISLGHIAFTGLGAYTTTIMINESSIPFWATLPIAFVVCFAFGALVGLPALKIRGLYLALVTFALAYTFPILVKIEGGGIARRTGGDNGQNLRHRLLPTRLTRSLLMLNGKDDPSKVAIYKYFVLLLIAAVCFLLMRNIVKSRAGRAMIAIRDNQIGAAVSGVPLSRQKVLTFAISAAFAGIGGSMLAGAIDSVGPTTFDANYAVLTLMGLVLAGAATLHGCWVGGLLVVFLQDFAPRLVKHIPFVHASPVYARAVFGVILVLVAFFLPGGIVSAARRVKARVVRVIPARPMALPPLPAATATATDAIGTTVGSVTSR